MTVNKAITVALLLLALYALLHPKPCRGCDDKALGLVE